MQMNGINVELLIHVVPGISKDTQPQVRRKITKTWGKGANWTGGVEIRPKRLFLFLVRGEKCGG